MAAKRIICIIAAILLAACTELPPTATVSFNIGGVRSGTLTKSGDGLEAALAATAPTQTPELTIQSTSVSLRRYTAKPGESITLPVGEYRVTATYTPSVAGDAAGSNIFRQPSYSVDDVVVVTEDNDAYTVDAAYTCFALVIDYSESAKYRHYHGSYGWRDFSYFTGDTYGVAYIDFAAVWSATPYRITAVPKDAVGHEETQYSLVNEGTNGVLVEAGKWYLFSPDAVTTTSGALSVALPDWVQGN